MKPTSSTIEALEPRRLASAAHHVPRIGVLGDSYSDEYHFYPPDRTHARNWVEQLANHHLASFGAYTTHSRGTPRNQGYANDWALNGATSADLPAQTAGLAAQAAAGQIDIATILIGGNDILDLLAAAAADPSLDATTPAALNALVTTVVTNIETAANTLLAASPTLDVVLTTLPPINLLPVVTAEATLGMLQGTPAATLLVDAGAAEQQINDDLEAFADAPRMAVAEFAAASSAFSGTEYIVGRTPLSTRIPGDNPHHLFLADGLHPGTVAQALLANTVAQTVDYSFKDFYIKPLTPRQILADARL